MIELSHVKACDARAEKQGGFTLIELSIVLVIIGLIVGGVLVGQDLIQAAQTRAQVSQFEKMDATMNTFRTKYNSLPGDVTELQATQFGFTAPTNTAQVTTLGNGLIESGATDGLGVCGETALVWNNLGTAALIEGSFNDAASTDMSAAAAGGCTAAVNIGAAVPAGKMGGFLAVFTDVGQTFYQLTNVTAIAADGTTTAANNIIPTIQAYNIDAKMDDGIPFSGRVMAQEVTGLNNNTATDGTGFVDAAAGGGCTNGTGATPATAYLINTAADQSAKRCGVRVRASF